MKKTTKKTTKKRVSEKKVVINWPEPIPEPENKPIGVITETFGNGDLNTLRDKINEIITRGQE